MYNYMVGMPQESNGRVNMFQQFVNKAPHFWWDGLMKYVDNTIAYNIITY